MCEIEWSEKRQNVRVPVSIKAKAKLLNPEMGKNIQLHKQPMSLPKENAISENISSVDSAITSLSDFLIKIEDESDPTISYFANSLHKIGEKLDWIIEKLGGDTDGIKVVVKDTIDISGTGISLLTPDLVGEGGILEISLEIPGFPLGWFKTYGKVIHVKSLKETGKGLYNIGIRYIGISQRDQERLIAFSFSQQRKNIRQSKQ